MKELLFDKAFVGSDFFFCFAIKKPYGGVTVLTFVLIRKNKIIFGNGAALNAISFGLEATDFFDLFFCDGSGKSRLISGN